jgi:type IV pilus assembly protein PilM
MANPRFAWGIDIGNRALKAVKLVRDGDEVRVDDFDCIEHETVLSNAGDNRETLVTNAISQFATKHQIKGAVCAIGVSGQSSFARFIKLPPVEKSKIPEIVRFEAIQQIPFPLDDVEWSYQLFQQSDSPDVEVGIFAMRKELVAQHIKEFTDQDLNVQVVQMNPLAVYNGMSYDQRIEGTTMIIDLGAENTDLIIADAETIWLRSIPIGGNNFTEALVKAFKLNFPKAEDLKRNAATSKYARQIFQAMRPVFADLVAEVQRSIGFYASVHRDSRIKKILAVGGTFKLPGLQKYLQQNLQLEVERLDTLGAGGPLDPKQGAAYQDNVLSLVSAYGLALQAMGEGKITSSLLPARIKRERAWQEKTKWFAAAAALFVVGTGIGYTSIFLGQVGYDTQSDARAKIQTVLGTANGLSTQWDDISSKGGPDRQRILNVRSLADYRDMWTHLLSDIQKALPPIPPVDQLKQIPRNQRKVVRIDSLTHRYLPDLSLAGDLKQYTTEQQTQSSYGGNQGSSAFFSTTAAPSSNGPVGMEGDMGGDVADLGMPAPTPTPAATPSASGHGYVVRIAGTTPSSTAISLLQQTLVKGLMDQARHEPGPDRPYKVQKVEVIFLQPLRNDQTKLQAMKAAYDAAVNAKRTGTFTPAQGNFGGFGGGEGGDMMDMDAVAGGNIGGGFGGGFAPQAAPAQPADAELAYKDRRFPNEDIRNDQEFVAVALVQLDPPPAQPGAEGQTPTNGNGATTEPAPSGTDLAPATPATPGTPAEPATPAATGAPAASGAAAGNGAPAAAGTPGATPATNGGAAPAEATPATPPPAAPAAPAPPATPAPPAPAQ